MRIVPSNVDLMDPAYNPCICDLTDSLCDLECCCDPDCSETDKNVFKNQCLPIKRAVFDKTANIWYCNDIYDRPRLIEPDWFPIMCIHVKYIII